MYIYIIIFVTSFGRNEEMGESLWVVLRFFFSWNNEGVVRFFNTLVPSVPVYYRLRITHTPWPARFISVGTSPSLRPSSSWSSLCRRRFAVNRSVAARTTNSRRTSRPWVARTRPPGRWVPPRPRSLDCRARNRSCCCSGRTATRSAQREAPWRPTLTSSWSTWRPLVWAPAVPWSPGTWTWPVTGTATRTSCSCGACLDL